MKPAHTYVHGSRVGEDKYSFFSGFGVWIILTFNLELIYIIQSTPPFCCVDIYSFRPLTLYPACCGVGVTLTVMVVWAEAIPRL